MLRKLIRFIARYTLPARQEGEPVLPVPPGTVPIGGGPTNPTPPAPGGAAAGAGGGGGGPALPEGVDVQELLRKAKELDEVNTRLRELESRRDEDIRSAAENLLLEVMPEYAEERMRGGQSYGAPAGYQHPTQDPNFYRTPPQGVGGEGEGEGELSPEERMSRDFMRLQQEHRDLADQLAADRLQQRVDRAAERFPHADRGRVLTYLANLGDRADRVNVEKLVEISHGKELRRLNEYAHNYHLEELKKLQKGGSPPPLPGKGIAAPSEGGPKITRQNASSVLAERLRASGFGGGR